MNKEKFYIATIILLVFLMLYLVFIHKQKIEVIFSKPVYPIGNSTIPEKSNIWDRK